MPDNLPLDLPDDLDALQITLDDDGGVTIEEKPPEDEDGADPNHDENLAAKIEPGELVRIAQDVLEGIESDIESRRRYVDNLARAMDLLALNIDEQGGQSTGAGGTKSSVRHPVMLEAVVSFQSTTRAELLPSGGPCKVQVIGEETPETDQMARALEQDMNAYLTVGAPEYYPDMDRGLFGLGFSGNLFKKVYRHPLRRRPVSECIAVEDLIVPESATDLDTAIRVTHQVEMPPVEARQMMDAGYWLDVALGEPMQEDNAAHQKQAEITGTDTGSLPGDDRMRTVYECTTDLDILGMQEPGQEGPLPYVVTVDRSSRNVLAIRRGWKPGDETFRRKQRFVHYPMVPGFGFLAFGYAHLLANQARTLTAIWRIEIDAGMFSVFPGGIKNKNMRIKTNEIRPNPGEFVDVDAPIDADLGKAFMPMPYKGPDATLWAMAQAIEQDARRLGAVPEMEVGEGRTNIPVGTMMSQIEQSTQNMAAVHKRLHTAQARELQLLKERFAENPDDLARFVPQGAYPWSKAQEFSAFELVPASDPNIPAQVHRIMRSTALVTLLNNPTLGPMLDAEEVLRDVLQNVGLGDVDRFIKPPAPGGPAPPDPKVLVAAQANQIKSQQLQLQGQKLAVDTADQQREAASDHEQNMQQLQSDTMAAHTAAADRQADLQSDAMKLETERLKIAAGQQQASADRVVDHHHRTADRAQDAAQFGAQHGLAVLGAQQTAVQNAHSRKMAEKAAARPVAKPGKGRK